MSVHDYTIEFRSWRAVRVLRGDGNPELYLDFPQATTGFRVTRGEALNLAFALIRAVADCPESGPDLDDEIRF